MHGFCFRIELHLVGAAPLVQLSLANFNCFDRDFVRILSANGRNAFKSSANTTSMNAATCKAKRASSEKMFQNHSPKLSLGKSCRAVAWDRFAALQPQHWLSDPVAMRRKFIQTPQALLWPAAWQAVVRALHGRMRPIHRYNIMRISACH